ncbi:hypothetical protein F1559_002822 [Cyanidiococcus yangmingshanensis]|uniref:RFTS domain-containing protein n=1 Tax=Cyanidiococcus yangmingshanensis TaxID=2690220 RepID=A0A7J7ILX3_9RHOD|nr:hypothetical protein F1559_002822 [Cyanidiococcus yangmingshanensis]
MRPRRKAARRAVQSISGVLKGEGHVLSDTEERSDQRQSLRRRRTRAAKRLSDSRTQANSSSSSESTSVVSGRARWRLPADSLSLSSNSSQFSTESEESSSEAVSEEDVAWASKRQQRRSKELKREEPRQRLALCSGNGALANVSSLGLDRRRVQELQPVDMWQLPATWRLLQVFSKRLGIPDLTPMELEHALEAPQFAPVLAEIMASLVGFRSSSGHQVEQGTSRTTATLQRADWVQRADSIWFPLFVRFFRQHFDEMVALGLCSEESSASNPSGNIPELSTLESGGWEAFLQLSASQRLLLLYALCEYVLCNPDEDHRYVKDLRQLRHDDLRILPVGMDRYGALYWYFDDNCRLYREWFGELGAPTAKSANHRRKSEKPEHKYGWVVAAEGPESLRDLMKELDDARPRSSERALRQWLERELLPTWEEHGRKLERLSRRRERLERLLATKRTNTKRKSENWSASDGGKKQERQRELERIERLAKRQRLEIERALRAAERERAEAEARQSRHERVLARNETQPEAEQGERAASSATGSLSAENTLTCEEDIPPEMNLSGYVEDGVANEGAGKLDATASLPYRVLTWFRIMDAESGEHACLDSLELEQSSQKVAARRPPVPGAARSLVAEGLLVPGSGAGSVKLRPIMIRTGRILEWCIDYGEVCIWIRTDRAWYKLVTPHPSHEPHYVTTRRKFELAIRVSILCASFPNSKACSFRNLSKLLALPYGEMRGYTPEEIIEEAQFLVQQAEMLDRPEMRDNAFMRRLRREIEAAAQRERARLQRRQQRAAQRMRQQNRERVAAIPPKILIKWDHHIGKRQCGQ